MPKSAQRWEKAVAGPYTVGADIRNLLAHVANLQVVLDKARADNNLTLCVYCGETKAKGSTWEETKVLMAEHIAKCEAHPVRQLAVLEGERNALRAERDKLLETLEEIVEGGVTDADTCPFCCADITRHVAGCQIGNADALLKELKASTPAPPALEEKSQ